MPQILSREKVNLNENLIFDLALIYNISNHQIAEHTDHKE